MVVWQGSSSKIESFCHGASCGYFYLIALVVQSMRGYLAMKKFAANALRAKNFMALATST
jgi:hypothetical protein